MKRLLGRAIVRDWPLKLVSLVLALAVWLLLVPYEKVSSAKSMTIPLETRNVPAGLEIVEPPLIALGVKEGLPLHSTLAIEPKAIIDGLGGFGVEDTLLLEPGGVRSLTSIPLELISV